MLDLLADPWRFDLTRRAMLAVIAVSMGCGVLGVLVVWRGLSFIGDALAHCAVPGVVVGFLTRTSFEAWGVVSALLAAWGMALLARRGWLGGDASIAIVFTSAFALGLAMISATGSYLNDLTEILFGNPLAAGPVDIALSALVALWVVGVVVLLYRPLVFASFDPTAARVAGLPVGLLDAALYGLIALAVVAGVAVVGSVLVTALLIVPPAAARLLARRVWTQMAVSAGLGGLAGVLGLYASYYLRLATGGSVVLAAVALFLAALLVSPRGVLRGWARRRTPRPALAGR
ncbi:MAG: metal ABC transporter permease [Chloroflexi bacterium]|nr:metal ABC transporter permease [Chloroflexota bacterium]